MFSLLYGSFVGVLKEESTSIIFELNDTFSKEWEMSPIFIPRLWRGLLKNAMVSKSVWRDDSWMSRGRQCQLFKKRSCSQQRSRMFTKTPNQVVNDMRDSRFMYMTKCSF